MDSVRWKRQDFAKIDRLVVFERFVCKETCFKFNALFDWEPVKFLQDRFNVFAFRSEGDGTCQ